MDEPTQQILGVARSFPCLRVKLLNYNPERFEPERFRKMSGYWSSGEQRLARFVLTVWNSSWAREHGCLFDFAQDVVGLDGIHRAALAAWVTDPLFP